MPDKTDIGMWRAEVDRFRLDCEQSSAVQEEALLREAVRLIPVEIDLLVFEAFIGQGAFESAALAIIGRAAPFMLSRSGDGDCLATIAGPGVEVTAQGASPALALLGAWAAALLARVPGSGAERGDHLAAAPPYIH